MPPAALVAEAWLVIHALFEGFWVLLDRGHLIRRVAFFFTLYLTWESYHFCFEAARASGWDAASIGACFGILTPISGLQALAFKFYNDGRQTANVPDQGGVT